MAIPDEEKLECIKIIRANKWYTFDEAEEYLRKHWKSENATDGDYLRMKRQQIQKIIASDIIGSYFEIHDNKKEYTQEEWTQKKIYGWDEVTEYWLGDDEISRTDELHVFPKYDYLFPENVSSIILSDLDEKLEIERNIHLREVYEEMKDFARRGKTSYIMTEAYLFALKHEIERREYSIVKRPIISTKSPKEIKAMFDTIRNKDDLRDCVINILNEFKNQIKDEVLIHQKAREVEHNRFKEIQFFLKGWKDIIDNVDEIFKYLSNEGYFEKMNSYLQLFNEPYLYELDYSKKLEKINNKYIQSLDDKQISIELLKRIQTTVYTYEQYELEKFKDSLEQDNELIRSASSFRYEFSTVLHNIIREKSSNARFIREALISAGIKSH